MKRNFAIMSKCTTAKSRSAGVCIECWLELHCIVEQHLLRVPDDTKFFELFGTKIAPKLRGEDYHKEFVILNVSPKGKGESNIVQHEDNINLSISFGCRYIKFQVNGFVTKPAMKCICPDFPYALDTWLTNAAKQDYLQIVRPVVSHKEELLRYINVVTYHANLEYTRCLFR